MRKSAAIILNPVSGHGNSLNKAHEVQRLLDQAGLDVALFLTEASGHGRTLAIEIAASVEVIVCVGGDGTINEIANGMVDVGHDTPILIIPTGTANVVFRELGLPNDLKSQAKLAIDSPIRLLDLGRAGDRFFIMCAGVGFDAAIVDTISQTRTQSGITMLNYILPTLREASRYDFPRMRLTIDGVVIDDASTFAIIGNIPRYGGLFRLFKDSSPCDGLLDVCCFHAKNAWDLGRYAWGAFRQKLMGYNDVAFYRGKEIKVEADEQVLVQVDGDPGGKLPMVFSIMPSAVSFCVEYPESK
jgi:YegS/Rv2252/BmrU family lipid kinase